MRLFRIARLPIGHVVGGLVAGVVLVTGACRGDQPMQPVQSRVADGREVFRGVFLGEGVVGKRLAVIWDGRSLTERLPDGLSRAKLQSSVDSLVTSLAARDAGFFARFADEMQSGDPPRVEAALFDAVNRMQRFQPMAAQQQAAAPSAAAIIYQVVHIYQVYYVYEAVAIYFAAAAVEAAVITQRLPELMNSKDGLKRDVIVRDIARSLAAT